jgi:hypothetical protein
LVFTAPEQGHSMTGRTGSLATESTTISATDAARIAEEERLHAEWQRRAARVIAAGARDLADCRLLLDILGLDSGVLAAARTERPARTSVRDAAGTRATRAKTGSRRRAHAA